MAYFLLKFINLLAEVHVLLEWLQWNILEIDLLFVFSSYKLYGIAVVAW